MGRRLEQPEGLSALREAIKEYEWALGRVVQTDYVGQRLGK